MGDARRGHVNGGQWYRREERLRRAFIASRGSLDVAAVQTLSGATPDEARLVVCARTLACLEVLEAYEHGDLTFRQLWCACMFVGDPPMQRQVTRTSATFT